MGGPGPALESLLDNRLTADLRTSTLPAGWSAWKLNFIPIGRKGGDWANAPGLASVKIRAQTGGRPHVAVRMGEHGITDVKVTSGVLDEVIQP